MGEGSEPPPVVLCAKGCRDTQAHRTMILIEPTIQAKFGRKLRQRALSVFLREAAAAAGLKGEISVLLTGDEQLRSLNRQFRGKNKPTDVLSFPAAPQKPKPGPGTGAKTGPKPSSDGPARNAYLAGDLAVSVETAGRQADELGHGLATEVQILMLHGLLHLGGYDHETDAGQMARKEALLRRRFRLTAGLIERAARGAKPAGSRKRSQP